MHSLKLTLPIYIEPFPLLLGFSLWDALVPEEEKNASVLITNSPILLWLFHLHLVHDFVSFAHTNVLGPASLNTESISAALWPCAANMFERQTWWECFTACSLHRRPIESTSHDREYRFILLLLISSSNRRSNTACHINNSLKVKFSYLKCVCVGETKKAEYQEQVEAETEVSDINRKLDVLIDFLFHDSKD